MPNSVLLVDVGNTRIKYLENGSVRYVERFGELPLDHVSEVRIATVSRHEEINAWSKKLTVPVRLAKVKKAHRGMTVAYEDVARLGVDRWLAMLARWVETQSGFTVVDLGTAITIDSVDGQGCHAGGYIVPGFRLMKESLGLNTAQVGFGGESASTHYGVNTADCVDHGINRMISAFVAGVARCEAVENDLVLTGGDAQKVNMMPLGKNCEIDETLVIRGLRYCFE